MPDDFSLKPDFVFDETPQFSTIISQFENGSEQRRDKWNSPLTKYRLVYENISVDDKGTILSLFTSKKGALSSFSWTHPISGISKTVRFVEDSLLLSNLAYGRYSIEFELVEMK